MQIANQIATSRWLAKGLSKRFSFENEKAEIK